MTTDADRGLALALTMTTTALAEGDLQPHISSTEEAR
jgi:hypothetical protein